MVYDLGLKPTKSQIFAQKIYLIAVNDQDFAIEAMSPIDLEHLADEVLQRFPKECDARFRRTAIGHIRGFQRACGKD